MIDTFDFTQGIKGTWGQRSRHFPLGVSWQPLREVPPTIIRTKTVHDGEDDQIPTVSRDHWRSSGDSHNLESWVYLVGIQEGKGRRQYRRQRRHQSGKRTPRTFSRTSPSGLYTSPRSRGTTTPSLSPYVLTPDPPGLGAPPLRRDLSIPGGIERGRRYMCWLDSQST